MNKLLTHIKSLQKITEEAIKESQIDFEEGYHTGFLRCLKHVEFIIENKIYQDISQVEIVA